jgi:hypothetical protein
MEASMLRILRAGGRLVAVVVATLGAHAAPAQAQNCAPFTDVLASSSFCGNIQWLFNRGITQGCTATQYCPANFVRRDQMAAFLNRLANNLFPLNCAAGQVMKWTGVTWACAADNPGVTSITAGTGLTGGTIMTSGTIAADTSYLQRRVSVSCGAGSSIRAIAADGGVTCETDDAGPANAFVQGGNAFATVAVLGTNDAQPVEIKAGNARVMRYEPSAESPNVIGGNPANSVAAGAVGATIGGGGSETQPNQVAGAYGAVAGGQNNRAGSWSSVGGGYSNHAVAGDATIVGGSSNQALGSGSTILGGLANFSGSQASYSLAAGRDARVFHPRTFLWNGWSSGDAVSFRTNAVEIRGENGLAVEYGARVMDGGGSQWVVIGPIVAGQAIATSTGGFLSVGGQWVDNSDVASKTDFRTVDPADVLARVATLPIASWRYRAENENIRHIGPTAQDFNAAFGLGFDDKSIAALDASGVALVAIQAMHAKLADLRAEVAELKARLADLVAKRSQR